MSQSTVTYEAAVYSRSITYTNLKGETKTVELNFALSPIDLMGVLSNVPTNKTRSKDPRKQNQEAGLTDAQQIKLVQSLAAQAAGFISDDGETFEPYETFANDIAGQAFLTKLVSSDADRKEFAEKVILAPFRAFVEYARVDESNTPKDIQDLEKYLADLERAFTFEAKPEETLEERRARLAAELESLGGDN
jgi:hypothetical protein